MRFVGVRLFPNPLSTIFALPAPSVVVYLIQPTPPRANMSFNLGAKQLSNNIMRPGKFARLTFVKFLPAQPQIGKYD